MSLEHAVAQLRHLYAQMNQGIVLDSRRAAQGILGPAIEEIERFQRGEAPPSAETRPETVEETGARYLARLRRHGADERVIEAATKAIEEAKRSAAAETERAPAPRTCDTCRSAPFCLSAPETPMNQKIDGRAGRCTKWIAHNPIPLATSEPPPGSLVADVDLMAPAETLMGCPRCGGKGVVPMAPRCACTHEAGDSPCPMHGMDEEPSEEARPPANTPHDLNCQCDSFVEGGAELKTLPCPAMFNAWDPRPSFRGWRVARRTEGSASTGIRVFYRWAPAAAPGKDEP